MLGDFAALACATLFAFCSLAFAEAGRMIGSLAVNVLRIAMACLLLALGHQLFVGGFWPRGLDEEAFYWIAASGLVGLALGDLSYFHALAVLGPRLGTLLMATFPVFTVLGEGLLLGAWPGWEELLCMLGIMAGVFLVLGRDGDAQDRAERARLGRAVYAAAVLAGLGGALGQGLGLVLVKTAEDLSPEPVHTLSVTLVRMVAGCLLMLPLAVARLGPRRLNPWQLPRRALAFLLIGTLCGPVLGVWLSMVAVQFGDAARAAVLIALVPVLMIPIEGLRLQRWPGPLGWAGTLLAFAGAASLIATR